MAETAPEIPQELDAFEKGWRLVSKKPVVLSEPDRAVLWSLVREAHKAHRFDGAAGIFTCVPDRYGNVGEATVVSLR